MFNFCCKRLQLQSISNCRDLGSSLTHLGFLYKALCTPKSFFSSSSSIDVNPKNNQEQSFTLSYLINSCRLSRETAEFVSKKLKLHSLEKPDLILELLRNHGFTNTHISKILRSEPLLLLANAEIISSKLEFLRSKGVSSPDLAYIIASNPSVLRCSLKDRIIPNYNFLKSLVLLDSKVVKALKHSPRNFHKDMPTNFDPKISILRELGVPQSSISVLVTRNSSLFTFKAEKFDENVKKVIEMGFNPLRFVFIQALISISNQRKSNWEFKKEIYRRWGWSEDDILLAFKKQPICMSLSEKKIMSAMDFYVNKMGWQSSVITKNPIVLFFSLEKRIIPRCSVIKVLQLKGLENEEICSHTAVIIPDNSFLDRYVSKYKEHVPQLLNIYRGKMSLMELGLGFEEKFLVKQI